MEDKEKMVVFLKKAFNKINNILQCRKHSHILEGDAYLFVFGGLSTPCVYLRKKCSRCRCWATIKVIF